MKCTNEGVLFCTCGAPIRIQCSEGHTNCRTDNWFLPTSKMTTMLRQNIHNAFKQDALDFDMCVMGSQLHIIHTNSFTADGIEISFDDIQCFSALPIDVSDTTKEFAARLGEKCNGTCSYSKIQKCTSDCTMGCLPKAFYTILPGFRPQPHKGLEYGDVSCSLETSYGFLEMKGIIKKNSKNTGSTKTLAQLTSQNLLSTSKEGQEIIRQFVEQGMSDARTDLIAVIAPQYFDNSLKGTLRFLAKMSNKKILFVELDNIARIIEGNKYLSSGTC